MGFQGTPWMPEGKRPEIPGFGLVALSHKYLWQSWIFHSLQSACAQDPSLTTWITNFSRKSIGLKSNRVNSRLRVMVLIHCVTQTKRATALPYPRTKISRTCTWNSKIRRWTSSLSPYLNWLNSHRLCGLRIRTLSYVWRRHSFVLPGNQRPDRDFHLHISRVPECARQVPPRTPGGRKRYPGSSWPRTKIIQEKIPLRELFVSTSNETESEGDCRETCLLMLLGKERSRFDHCALEQK